MVTEFVIVVIFASFAIACAHAAVLAFFLRRRRAQKALVANYPRRLELSGFSELTDGVYQLHATMIANGFPTWTKDDLRIPGDKDLDRIIYRMKSGRWAVTNNVSDSTNYFCTEAQKHALPHLLHWGGVKDGVWFEKPCSKCEDLAGRGCGQADVHVPILSLAPSLEKKASAVNEAADVEKGLVIDTGEAEFKFTLPANRVKGMKPGEKYESEEFHLLGIRGALRVRFFPLGLPDAIEGKCSLYLWSERSVEAQFRVSVNNEVKLLPGAPMCWDAGKWKGEESFCPTPRGEVTVRINEFQAPRGFTWTVYRKQFFEMKRGDKLDCADFHIEGSQCPFRMRYFPWGSLSAADGYCSLFIRSEQAQDLQVRVSLNGAAKNFPAHRRDHWPARRWRGDHSFCVMPDVDVVTITVEVKDAEQEVLLTARSRGSRDSPRPFRSPSKSPRAEMSPYKSPRLTPRRSPRMPPRMFPSQPLGTTGSLRDCRPLPSQQDFSASSMPDESLDVDDELSTDESEEGTADRSSAPGFLANLIWGRQDEDAEPDIDIHVDSQDQWEYDPKHGRPLTEIPEVVPEAEILVELSASDLSLTTASIMRSEMNYAF